MGDFREGVRKHLNGFKNTLCVFFFFNQMFGIWLSLPISLGDTSFASVKHYQLFPLTLAETL